MGVRGREAPVLGPSATPRPCHPTENRVPGIRRHRQRNGSLAGTQRTSEQPWGAGKCGWWEGAQGGEWHASGRLECRGGVHLES